MNNLKKILKDRGISLGWFAENILSITYNQLNYRITRKTFKQKEIDATLDYLENCTYEELRGNKAEKSRSKKSDL